MNTEKEKNYSSNDKFFLDLVTFRIDMLYEQVENCDELDEENYEIATTALTGSTFREALCCVGQLLIDAHIRLARNENPFDYGDPLEMIWSSLYDYVMDYEKGDYVDSGRCLLSAHPEIELIKSKMDDDDALREVITCAMDDELSFDGVCTLLIFYPHAWTDEMEKAKTVNIKKVFAELNFVMDQNAQEIICDAYCNRHEHDTVHQEENKKPTKPAKEKIVKSSKSLYLMKCKSTGYYKIGISGNATIREKTLQAEKPTIEIVAQWQYCSYLEKIWHKYYHNYRLRGEWFDLTKTQAAFMCSTMKQDKEKILEILAEN